MVAWTTAVPYFLRSPEYWVNKSTGVRTNITNMFRSIKAKHLSWCDCQPVQMENDESFVRQTTPELLSVSKGVSERVHECVSE